jgi:hypothetical protein
MDAAAQFKLWKRGQKIGEGTLLATVQLRMFDIMRQNSTNRTGHDNDAPTTWVMGPPTVKLVAQAARISEAALRMRVAAAPAACQ